MRSVSRSLRASSYFVLASSLLILVLHSSPIAQPEAVTAASQSSNNVIRVWTVGSPHTGVFPPAVVHSELHRRAEILGYTLKVETFRASGFADKFRQAQQQHNEPEVITFDNYGVVAGLKTATVRIEGIASDPQTASSLVLVDEALAALQPRGWVMLIRSAVNYEAAKALAMQPPVCEARAISAAFSPNVPELRQAQEAATFAARAYLDCDQSTLSLISDQSRLGQKCFLAESDKQIETVKACRASGNSRLAFVSLVSNFSAQLRGPVTNRLAVHTMELGQQSIFAVLRNQDGVWRLLAITDDPVNTIAIAERPFTKPAFESSLDNGRTSGFTPEPAQLLTPDGIYPRPPRGERFGDFVWEPSQSSDVIAQVVEFMVGKDSVRGQARLFFLPARDRKLSSGFLWSGGTSAWRVWSITKNGDIAFSEQRSYPH